MKSFPIKTLLLFSLSLLLLACKEEKVNKTDENLPGEYQPTEVTKSSSLSADVSTVRYTYDQQGQVTQEDVYSNGTLQNYARYTYNAAGKLQKRVVYDKAGRPKEQDVYIFNTTNQPEKWQHSYFTPAGTDTLHHYRTYQYTPDGKISRTSEFTPVGKLQNTSAYEFADLNLVRLKVYDKDNQLTYTHEYTYDGKKSPFAETKITVVALPGNVTSEVATDAAQQVVLRNQSAITYNQAGYPTKIIRTSADGSTRTETYTYRVR